MKTKTNCPMSVFCSCGERGREIKRNKIKKEKGFILFSSLMRCPACGMGWQRKWRELSRF